jgi:transposase-like protein
MDRRPLMSKTVSPENRRSREEWERLMAEYEAGEVSQRAFCAEHGLAYSSFGYWRKRLRGAVAAGDRPMPALVELPAWCGMAVEPSPWRLELELGEGMVLRVR